MVLVAVAATTNQRSVATGESFAGSSRRMVHHSRPSEGPTNVIVRQSSGTYSRRPLGCDIPLMLMTRTCVRGGQLQKHRNVSAK